MNVPKIMNGVGSAFTTMASKTTNVANGSIKTIGELQSFKLLNNVDGVQSSFKATDVLMSCFQEKAKKVIAKVRGLCDKAEKTLGLVNSTCSIVTDGIKNKVSDVKACLKKQPSFKAHQA